MPDLSGVAAFYATHSSFSAPGVFAALYADLPSDPARLARVTRDLMIHRWEGRDYHYDIPRERLHNDAEARDTYLQEDRLRIPRTVLSLAPFNGPREVTLRELR
ncbi:hypothetical protein [Nonomuraea helvata]|uniref:Uncharacterized protein n=1 Tax=Nonomuraea helvata TaxID=37484 RepID=A0ABV5SAL0_9ACTN